ncbi:MAG: hypothetical protein PUB21_10495 [Bacteroidales bacterium]|nr:hypothetical protein [Bacteroidales bacterium]
MDATIYIYIGFLILTGIIILSIPPFLFFLLYKHLKKKGKTLKNIGLLLFILCTLGMITLGIRAIPNSNTYEPKFETTVIEQKIGGKLLCNSSYFVDLRSYDFFINYTYINASGDTIDFEGGTYNGREWEKDEQIVKLGKFLILKTGSSHDSDKLIIKNIQTNETKTIVLDRYFVENNTLWKIQNITTQKDRCCFESFIENFEGNKFLLKYKFKTNEYLIRKYGVRMITFQIDEKNGDVKMIKVEQIFKILDFLRI